MSEELVEQTTVYHFMPGMTCKSCGYIGIWRGVTDFRACMHCDRAAALPEDQQVTLRTLEEWREETAAFKRMVPASQVQQPAAPEETTWATYGRLAYGRGSPSPSLVVSAVDRENQSVTLNFGASDLPEPPPPAREVSGYALYEAERRQRNEIERLSERLAGLERLTQTAPVPTVEAPALTLELMEAAMDRVRNEGHRPRERAVSPQEHERLVTSGNQAGRSGWNIW